MCARCCKRRTIVIECDVPMCGECFASHSMSKLRVPKRSARAMSERRAAAQTAAM
jgi:hypothetical protein